MNFDPQKFFIGLMDFFSILLPGALLAFVLMNQMLSPASTDSWVELDDAQAWGTFLFASYLLGHLVFLLGAWLDTLYDLARRYTLNTQIKWLAHRDCLLPGIVRAAIWLVFKDERDLAVNRVGKIKRDALNAIRAKDAINNFQWSKVDRRPTLTPLGVQF